MASLLNSKKRLWIVITIYIAVIYSSLSLMRSFIGFLYNSLGVETVEFGINSLLILSILAFLIFISISINTYQKQKRLVLILVVMALGGGISMSVEVPVERIHFLEYGILGYLVFKATIDTWKLPFIFSLLFVSVIGMGDEIIQWFLPSRVGDLMDVCMNSFGGLLGIGIKRLKDGKV